MRGRRLYAKLAEESALNARRLLLDSRALRGRGSRGHACSLAILGIEEGSKAIIYRLAAEGIYRIVRRKPNRVSTFSEDDLLDHRFKHRMVAALLVGAIQFAPFAETLSATRRKTFTRDQVETLLRAVHARQQFQAATLQRPSRAAREVTETFRTLERLNALKNDGLYVGHSKGRIRLPNFVSDGDRVRVDELAEVVVRAATETVQSRLSGQMRQELTQRARAVARQVLTSKKATEGSAASISGPTAVPRA